MAPTNHSWQISCNLIINDHNFMMNYAVNDNPQLNLKHIIILQRPSWRTLPVTLWFAILQVFNGMRMEATEHEENMTVHCSDLIREWLFLWKSMYMPQTCLKWIGKFTKNHRHLTSFDGRRFYQEAVFIIWNRIAPCGNLAEMIDQPWGITRWVGGFLPLCFAGTKSNLIGCPGDCDIHTPLLLV